jgi:hypothetical protein
VPSGTGSLLEQDRKETKLRGVTHDLRDGLSRPPVVTLLASRKSKVKTNNRKRNKSKRRSERKVDNLLRKVAQSREQFVAPYVRMVQDPCGSHLMPGIYGDTDGLLARTKRSWTFRGTQTCGYFLCDPTYMGALGPDHLGGSVFAWKHSDSTIRPGNDGTISIYGRQALDTSDFLTAIVLADPSHQLTDSDLCEDARHVSSCLSLTYIGAQLVASGQVGFLENVPARVLLTGGDGGLPANVD